MNAKIALKDKISRVSFITRKLMKSKLFKRNKCRILIYHAVEDFRPDKDSMGLAVTTASFYQQMRYLKENKFYIMGLTELVDRIEGKSLIPERAVVISFDDGYRGVLTNAMPILKEFNFGATLFVNINFIECKLPNFQYWYDWDVLSWKEIGQLDRSGLTIGSHALSHRKLTEVNNKELIDEVVKSKELIEGNINNRISLFSYPQGAFNKEIMKVVKDNDFRCACSSIAGVNDISSNLFSLKRTEITGFDNSISKFEMKVFGGYDWVGLFKR